MFQEIWRKYIDSKSKIKTEAEERMRSSRIYSFKQTRAKSQEHFYLVSGIKKLPVEKKKEGIIKELGQWKHTDRSIQQLPRQGTIMKREEGQCQMSQKDQGKKVEKSPEIL